MCVLAVIVDITMFILTDVIIIGAISNFSIKRDKSSKMYRKCTMFGNMILHYYYFNSKSVRLYISLCNKILNVHNYKRE